jgi:hypothetical protein
VQAYTSSMHYILLAENIFMDQMDGQLLGYGNRERQLSHRESKPSLWTDGSITDENVILTSTR